MKAEELWELSAEELREWVSKSSKFSNKNYRGQNPSKNMSKKLNEEAGAFVDEMS